MRKRRAAAAMQPAGDIEGALAALSADELRMLVREMMSELDGQAFGRIANSLVNRAVRGGSGWIPAALSDPDVAEILSFAAAAGRVGHADPSEVDEYLRRGSGAFLRKDYAAAFKIFGALLRPIGEGEIDLGQDETVEDVLGVDSGECAARYVVAAYMISIPEKRAEAVRSAIEEVCSVGCFMEPLRDMERVAAEPLPGFDEFLPRWRGIVQKMTGSTPRGEWESEADRWLREVVRRMEGAGGLAQIARSTRRAADLRAWCQSLVEAGDWQAALPAFEEAAQLVADKEYARGELLDGAALAAQEQGRKDLPGRLEIAWRAAPSMLRLRRWLGAADGKAALRKWAAEALDACPKQAHRQRAFLHVLLGEFEPAAKLLASAPGLGWSDAEHPGHMLFSLFQTLLGDKSASSSSSTMRLPGHGMDLEELELLILNHDEPRLAAPEIDLIIGKAGVSAVADGKVRQILIESMRKAAELRVQGVTGNQRRRHYGHAASLVGICVANDQSPATDRWATRLRDEYRRYPAFRAELDRYLKSPGTPSRR
jgi:tetratricopeptide (TPR) repeat protein